MRLIFLSLLAVLSCVGIAHANDSAFGGAGGTVAPLKETRIRMASENIVLSLERIGASPRGRFDWLVSAKYVFENTTDKTVTIQMGFPELPCGGDNPCPGKFGFHGLKTSVRGKAVKHRTAQSENSANLPTWAPELGRVHLFDVTFAPREIVRVNHSYRHPQSGGLSPFFNFEIFYVTRTGALWAGPIGDATFTVRVPARDVFMHRRVLVPEEYALVSKTGPQKDNRIWEYRFKQTNWLPRQDFSLMFVQEPMTCYPVGWATRFYSSHLAKSVCGPHAKACKTAGATDEQRAKARAATRVEIFAEKTTAQVSACRNHIYAWYGYPFKSAELRREFYSPDAWTYWCDGSPRSDGSTPCEDGTKPSRTRVIFPGINKNYDPALLTRADHRYIRMARDELRAREARPKAPDTSLPAPSSL